MKKLFSILFLVCFTSVLFAQVATPRFGTLKNQDNTGRVLTYDVVAKTYSTTVTVTPNAYETFLSVATLTGNTTISATTTVTHKYDQLSILLVADTSTRTVTLGNGFAKNVASTLVLNPSVKGYLKFIFDGTAWVELSR